MAPLLPPQFAELEIFAPEWALEDEVDRCEKRVSSSMENINAFYDAIMPKMEAILEYLAELQLNAMPEEATRLLWLTLSLAEITPAIHFYGQPEMSDGCDFRRFQPIDVPNLSIPGDRPIAARAHHRSTGA
jgi:hypothetical protein